MAAYTTTSTTATVKTESRVLRKVAPKEIFRLDYRPPVYTIQHADLYFNLDASETKVESILTLHRTHGSPAGADLLLDGEELDLEIVELDSGSLFRTLSEGEDFHIVDSKLCVAGRLLPSNAEETFRIRTKVTINPSKNLKLMGLFKSNAMLLTQCEAEGFRSITYYLDRPDVMATFRVRLEADASLYPVLLSNGNRIGLGNLENNRHYALFEDPFPKPCYLFAIVAGDLKCLTSSYCHPDKTAEGRSVEVNIWCEPQDVTKLDWAMESVKRAMQWDEDTFGLAYDLNVFNIVCTRDFNMGAMENKSLNIFVSSLILATPETTTDAEYLSIMGVVGHEYFHNWTGDRVTCRDWFQLTLKEGLTVFRDQTFSSDMGSPAVCRIQDVRFLRSKQFIEDAGPLAHPIRPESYIAMDNFYTVTVYEKGAEIVRMYETILGKEGFRRGMDLYFKRHDGHAVTCDDFRSAMADANHVDFSQFERWYKQSGTPVLSVVSTCYNSTNHTFSFVVRQSTPDTPGQTKKLPFHIPIRAGLIGKNSKKEVASSEIFHLKNEQDEFIFSNVMESPVLSILRDFSAPVKLNFEQQEEELALLFGYDTDPFNRYDAGQKLALRILSERAKAIREGTCDVKNPPALPSLVIEAFEAVLTDPTLDMSFRALAMILPDEDFIGQSVFPCDPLAVHKARESFRRQIRAALEAQLRNTYEMLSSTLRNKSYAILPVKDNVAPRQLRNTVMDYLCCDASDLSAKLALDHFLSAQNMTDRFAALRALVNIPGDEKKNALQKFYNDANGDPLVIDKWFSIQAGANVDGLYDEIQTLIQHPEFTMKTPSRMRAVVFRFAANSPFFHSLDGSGYKFIADSAIELDGFNPSMAAHAAHYLSLWKMYDDRRQEQMKEQLRRILEKPNLSSETYEIVSKALLE